MFMFKYPDEPCSSRTWYPGQVCDAFQLLKCLVSCHCDLLMCVILSTKALCRPLEIGHKELCSFFLKLCNPIFLIMQPEISNYAKLCDSHFTCIMKQKGLKSSLFTFSK